MTDSEGFESLSLPCACHITTCTGTQHDSDKAYEGEQALSPFEKNEVRFVLREVRKGVETDP